VRLPAARIDLSSVNRNTSRALTQGAEIMALADAYEQDADRYERWKDQLCCACFYLRRGRLAGQAFTDRPCGVCGVSMTFPTTATDALCPECSKKLKLCKRCGADIELRKRRKLDVPKPAEVETGTVEETTVTMMLLPKKEDPCSGSSSDS